MPVRACLCGLLAFFAFFILLIPAARAAALSGGEANLSGVREGWSWPIIVIQPPEGWDSPAGVAIKYGMRAAEREISLSREGIRGFEATFMFSSVADPSELTERMNVWRGMKSCAIISFGSDQVNLELKRLCALEGPSVIFAGGENLAIKNPVNDLPFPYLFALDFTYFARANALAEFARREVSGKSVVVMTDGASEKLARGAEINVAILRRRGVDAITYFIPGDAQYQFNAQIQEAVSGGAGVITSWLGYLSTLSVWRTVFLGRSDIGICFSGTKADLILDADGLVLVDKDDILNLNEGGKHAIIAKARDLFGKDLHDPVAAAKAYALAKWAISGFVSAGQADAVSVASALSVANGIPLMDEMLSIDPRTNRPKSRKFAVLRVKDRRYELVTSVDVYSIEVDE
jgi:hypothetical protein